VLHRDFPAPHEEELDRRSHANDLNNCQFILAALEASLLCSSFAHITDTTVVATSTLQAVSTVVTTVIFSMLDHRPGPVNYHDHRKQTRGRACYYVGNNPSEHLYRYDHGWRTDSQCRGYVPGSSFDETVTQVGTVSLETVTIPATVTETTIVSVESDTTVTDYLRRRSAHPCGITRVSLEARLTG